MNKTTLSNSASAYMALLELANERIYHIKKKQSELGPMYAMDILKLNVEIKERITIKLRTMGFGKCA